MKKGLLIFIIGLLTGVATSLFIHSNNQQANQVMIPSHLEKNEPLSETLTNEETGDIVRLNKQLNKKEARITRLDAENANLRNELRNLMKIRKAKSPRVAPQEPNGEQEELFLERIKERQIDSRLKLLTDRLALDINQEKTIRSLLDQQAQWRREQMESRMRGEEPENDDFEKPSFNLDDELEDILSDEQLEQYKELQDEENNTNSKIAAGIELERMSSKLGLSEEQKDKFYDVLYSEAYELISSSEGGMPSFQEGWQNDRLEKLKSVLTDDQFNEYSDLVADQNTPLPPPPRQ